MRAVRLQSPFYDVTDDPDRVIGDFLGYALSLRNLSGRPPAEEFAELFSPTGRGMRLPDVFAAYRAEEPDDIPEELTGQVTEVGRTELWVLTRLRYGAGADSVLVGGPELRHLLAEGLAQRAAWIADRSGIRS
ncbi:hypothetical protein [Planobispora takensis]|uniref:Uncharacterized protein n=1 Tax=Planobispora takensis TaxID=1367882 RepID=A0A8J3T3L5_9ACTN|nr:hypothetical protein [Planobispora takensis]GII05714.1 hypothetical protein Pta02_77220 [Planobispora takensis]